MSLDPVTVPPAARIGHQFSQEDHVTLPMVPRRFELQTEHYCLKHGTIPFDQVIKCNPSRYPGIRYQCPHCPYPVFSRTIEVPIYEPGEALGS